MRILEYLLYPFLFDTLNLGKILSTTYINVLDCKMHIITANLAYYFPLILLTILDENINIGNIYFKKTSKTRRKESRELKHTNKHKNNKKENKTRINHNHHSVDVIFLKLRLKMISGGVAPNHGFII